MTDAVKERPLTERRPSPWWQYSHRERRAPVDGGGTVAWWEHSLCWAGYVQYIQMARAEGDHTPVKPIPSEAVAKAGGFTLAEYEAYIGRLPRTHTAK